jgi:hypothetical protein
MKRIAIVLASALIAVLPVSAAHAQTPSAPKNAGVTGMWLGTNSGFENGVYKSSEVRYTITAVNGVALTGTKSWRQADGTWSDPESFQGVLYKSGDFHAADNDGCIIGRLVSPTKIRATYLEAGEDQSALVTVLTKASRQARR